MTEYSLLLYYSHCAHGNEGMEAKRQYFVSSAGQRRNGGYGKFAPNVKRITEKGQHFDDVGTS